MSFQCSLFGVCPAAMQPRLLERLRGLCQPICRDDARFIKDHVGRNADEESDDVDFRTSCLRFESVSSAAAAAVSLRVQWPSGNGRRGNHGNSQHEKSSDANADAPIVACVLSHCGPADPQRAGVSVRPVLAVPVWCPPGRKNHSDDGNSDQENVDDDAVALEVEQFVRALFPSSASSAAACRRWQYRQCGRAFIYRDQYRVLVTRLLPEDGENDAAMINNADSDGLWLVEVHSPPVEQSRIPQCCQDLLALSASVAGIVSLSAVDHRLLRD